MRRLPPLKALRAFEAAGRHQSIVKAADELSVSHSAVSQQIKLLEAYFRQPLFHRQGNRITLTQQAALYLEDVRFCFDRIANASGNLLSNGVDCEVRINTTPSFAMRWLVPRLPQLQRQHPNVSVRIETSTSDELPDSEQGFDLIIRRDAMSRPGMVCQRILDDESLAVLSPELLETLDVRRPDDLLKAPLLHMKSRLSSWPQWFNTAAVPAPHVLPGQTHDHFFLSLEAALNGMGVALAPRAIVEDDLSSGRLVALFPEHVLEARGFHSLFQERPNQQVQAVVDWLTEQN